MQYKVVNYKKMSDGQRKKAIIVAKVGRDYLNDLLALRDEVGSQELVRSFLDVSESVYSLLEAVGLVDEDDPIFEHINYEKILDDSGGANIDDIIVIEPSTASIKRPGESSSSSSSSSTYQTTLRKGDSGPPVMKLQALLTGKMYYSGLADGNFGDKTLRAVEDFQRARSLKVDGIVGNLTWNALNGVLPLLPYDPTLPSGTTPAPPSTSTTTTFAERRQQPKDVGELKKIWIAYTRCGKGYAPMTVSQAKEAGVDPRTYCESTNGAHTAWFYTEADAQSVNEKGITIELYGKIYHEKQLTDEEKLMSEAWHDQIGQHDAELGGEG